MLLKVKLSEIVFYISSKMASLMFEAFLLYLFILFIYVFID